MHITSKIWWYMKIPSQGESECLFYLQNLPNYLNFSIFLTKKIDFLFASNNFFENLNQIFPMKPSELEISLQVKSYDEKTDENWQNFYDAEERTHLCRPVRSTFGVRETASLGIMGAPRVPPLNPSESIVLWEHYRLWGV